MEIIANNTFQFVLFLLAITRIEGSQRKHKNDSRQVQVSGSSRVGIHSCSNICFNGDNCAKSECKGCFFACPPQKCRVRIDSCKNWCGTMSHCQLAGCQDCLFCKNLLLKCPIVTFKDETNEVFRYDSEFWGKWKHSNKPYFHSGPPVFVDMNDDNLLDFFNPMHGHPSPNQFENRMEIGIAAGANSEAYHLQNHSERIICTDKPDCNLEGIDAHGSVVVDLDGDGNLDVLISNGGGFGSAVMNPDNPKFDNWLFWGESRRNETTGEIITVFLGGRDVARKAGVNMPLGRSRFNYLFDANNDGMLDIFTSQDRRSSNMIKPGILLINQGNRTWREDTAMMEYSRAMMVTDADGDGFAQEFLLNRSFCYPFRNGPGVDESKPELGPYSQEIKQFCHRRPVGTNAIYRFNHTTKQIEEISKKYKHFWAGQKWTKPCCQNGSYDTSNDCNAVSMTSGDFDNDQRADHILLFSSKLVFFFSSDRPVGKLPDNAEHIGLEIKLPSYCNKGRSVQVVDLNNDGTEEILVSCSNPGTFLLYSQGISKRDWTLENGCNGNMALGALNNRFLALPTHRDVKGFCNLFANTNSTKWGTARTVCERYRTEGRTVFTQNTGMSIVDINNDGFQDVIAINSFGHLRFFYNKPSPENSKNKFITFKLVGDINAPINKYGIGTTIILISIDSRSNKEVKHFREISSVQHHSDKYGTKDDRITFGLGRTLTPQTILVKWPNRTVQTRKLDGWKFSIASRPIEIIYTSPT